MGKRKGMKGIQWLALLGIAVSCYALYVEHMSSKATSMGREYEALCDIAAAFSCTEVFKSSYGHILSHWGVVPKGHALDLSLAVTGVILYTAYFVAACLWNVMPFRKPLFLAVATAGACFSCYLLYVLKFVLGDFCIVCTGFHTVNFCMLAVAVLEFRAPHEVRAGAKAASKKL